MIRPMPIAGMAREMIGASARAAALDESAFRAFHAATAPRVAAYLRRALAGRGGASLADDLLQEAYLRFLCSRFEAANDDERTAYLFRIAVNLVRDHFRSPARREVELPPEAPDSGTTAAVELPGADLDSALGTLSPRDRSMLWLTYVEGASYDEVARALGLRRASLKSMLFRARRRLAEVLRSRGIGPAADRPPSGGAR